MPPFSRTPAVRGLSALAGLLLIAAAGCRDAAGPASAAPALASGPGSAGSGSAAFTVYAATPSTFVLGEHKIKFDANAVCDPATSGYGALAWDQPCAPAAATRITAAWWTDERGHPRIDFQPALRFNPAARVVLALMDKQAAGDPSYRIVWVDEQGALVDEAAQDTSVATHLATSGYLYRRVKHFSGYTVSTGRLGYDGLDVSLRSVPTVPPGPTPLQSGHVVATGRVRFVRP